ncbi:MAG TPA: hypothetical protein VMP03_04305 [Methylomirabilota bacterium]|nr:hypothetical protein [Methylomirabilota bacterium]
MRLFLTAALLLAGAVFIPAAPVFLATNAETGATIFCRPLPGDERVALVFTHSMYGGDVREVYAAGDDGRLRRVEMTTANAAAAEYYAYDGAVSRVGDRYRVEVPPASFDEIVVRVDRIGAQRLVWDGGDFDLLTAAGEGAPVRLTVERRSLVDRIFGVDC